MAEHYAYRPVYREEDICPTCTEAAVLTAPTETGRTSIHSLAGGSDVLFPCPVYARREFLYVDSLLEKDPAGGRGFNAAVDLLLVASDAAERGEPVLGESQVEHVGHCVDVFTVRLLGREQKPGFWQSVAARRWLSPGSRVWAVLSEDTRSGVLVAVASEG